MLFCALPQTARNLSERRQKNLLSFLEEIDDDQLNHLINGDPVERVSFIKYLGIYISDGATWKNTQQ